MSNLIAFSHIWKCGGTSVRHGVAKSLKSIGKKVCNHYHGLWASGDFSASTVAIFGHIEASGFALFPNAELVTFVRHPLSRIESHFRFWKSGKVEKQHIPEWFDPDDFYSFATHPDMINTLSRFVIAVDRFSYIGVFERLHLHFSQMLRHFELPQVTLSHINKTRDATNVWIDVTDDQKRDIIDLHSKDIELFLQVCDMRNVEPPSVVRDIMK